tara:strand:- start:13401 stop:13649 length:249 start_codon:yes stop_codon:yes gene_type:complete
MGGCVSKPTIVEAKSVDIIEVVDKETNTDIQTYLDDINGEYIWICKDVNNIDFHKFQENGFVISMNEYKNTGKIWMKRKRLN